jgi:transcriptional regulator with XRE-family HTH domain
MSNQTEGVENLLTEKELLDLFGVSKSTLSNLRRNQRLPFLQVTRIKRLYLESALMAWLRTRSMVLNALESNEEGMNGRD